MRITRGNASLLAAVGGLIAGVSLARSVASTFLAQAGICVAVGVVVGLALRAAFLWQAGRDDVHD